MKRLRSPLTQQPSETFFFRALRLNTELITEEDVLKSVEDVVDPEIQVGIIEMNLVDEVDISSDNDIKIRFHLTTPFCPAQFAYAIALQIKDRVSALPGVKKVVVEVKDHFLAKEINDAVNGDAYGREDA
mgnify:CR=1 FL=1